MVVIISGQTATNHVLQYVAVAWYTPLSCNNLTQNVFYKSFTLKYPQGIASVEERGVKHLTKTHIQPAEGSAKL